MGQEASWSPARPPGTTTQRDKPDLARFISPATALRTQLCVPRGHTHQHMDLSAPHPPLSSTGGPKSPWGISPYGPTQKLMCLITPESLLTAHCFHLPGPRCHSPTFSVCSHHTPVTCNMFLCGRPWPHDHQAWPSSGLHGPTGPVPRAHPP